MVIYSIENAVWEKICSKKKMGLLYFTPFQEVWIRENADELLPIVLHQLAFPDSAVIYRTAVFAMNPVLREKHMEVMGEFARLMFSICLVWSNSAAYRVPEWAGIELD
jgi:hypothetical protein